jgi:hypothetical protein
MAYRTSKPLHPTEFGGPEKKAMTTREKLHGHFRLPGQKGFLKQFTIKNLKKDYKWAYGGGMQKAEFEESVKGSKAPTPLKKRYNKPK